MSEYIEHEKALSAQKRCFAKRYGLFAEKTCPNFKEPSIITNADRIRAMTDEELAELIGTDQRNGGCPNGGARNCQESCVKCWLDWLREEVDHVD